MRKYMPMIIAFGVITFFTTLFIIVAIDTKNRYIPYYNKGVSLLKAGNQKEAMDCFQNIQDYIHYKDISELIIKYNVKGICPHCGEKITDEGE